jgi:LysR family transcriptional activator of nhaA
VFPATLALEPDLLQHHQVHLLGRCEGVEERYYAISTERKVAHPLIQRLLDQALPAER